MPLLCVLAFHVFVFLNLTLVVPISVALHVVNSNTIGVTCGAGTVNLSGALKVTTSF